jgi:hypothetical protein
MPIRSLPDIALEYHLVCYDKDGNERREEDGSLLSDTIAKRAADRAQGITDVFVMSHGWKGDVPAAIEQYDNWIRAMARCDADRASARRLLPGFTSLLVGFHWPSLPWGDESTGGSFDAGAGLAEDGFIQEWSDRIADTPAARQALRVLYRAARNDIEPERLPSDAADAYRVLEQEAQLGAAGVSGAPDADREPLDPQTAYEDWRDLEEMSFGGGSFGGLLSPLRQLSFWTMKKRARLVGERGGSALLRQIHDTCKRAAPPKDVRIHVMGHSFGCIVVSSMLRGADAHGTPASSAFLAQGAMSLWSYSHGLPGKPNDSGYFRPVIDTASVHGPIVVTTSALDRAVGTLYPLAAGAARQVDYDVTPRDLPTYGAIGAFGVQGDGLALEPRDISNDLTHSYQFQPGHIYNLKSDAVIKAGGGLSGAHSDIAHPEVGHAFWEAVLATADAHP